jgi:type I restriction enzyme M protein
MACGDVGLTQEKSTHSAAALTQRVWQYAHVLKDDGLAFMDYTEQITYLIFLKMASEQPRSTSIPSRYTWSAIKALPDDKQRLQRYHQGLRKLSELAGLIGIIFTKPQSKINDPAKLGHLIRMIDSVDWSRLDIDVKGEVYEGLLARNADDVRGGAGQYFTPRPVVRAVVEVMRPKLGMRICDPACGTGGFLLAAFEFLRTSVKDRKQEEFLHTQAFLGIDLVPNVARLCAMNLFLHGIGRDPANPAIQIRDSLASRGDPVDMVLTNPPFGKKSSITIEGKDGKRAVGGSFRREDFWATTSNKQLNFLQHAYSILRENGRAAIVVPDNVLFEGGAGEIIRRALFQNCDVHTLLRLPTGIWYSPGVKANVLFFDKKGREDRTQEMKETWIYDLRSGSDFSLRQRPISGEDLKDFIKAFCAEDRTGREETAKFRRFPISEILARDKASLDIGWKEPPVSSNSTTSHSLMSQIIGDLQEALEEFTAAENEVRRP